MRRILLGRVLIALPFVAGCYSTPTFDEATFIDGLRILTVVAEPAEPAPGATTQLTAFAVDPSGAADTIDLAWSTCTLPRPPSAALDPDCITKTDSLVSFGAGAQASFAVPAIDLATVGLPDTTGGVYLPLRLDAHAGAASDLAIERLRVATGYTTPNQNPGFAGVDGIAVTDPTLAVEKQPEPQPFDDGAPIAVRAREGVRLRPRFADGAAEMYLGLDVTTGEIGQVREQLRVSWFSTGGTFTNAHTGEEQPDTILRLNHHVPDPGQTIDVWLVLTDDRGGTAITHRALVVAP